MSVYLSRTGFVIVIELSLENDRVGAEGRRVHGVFLPRW